ncbi:MAG: methyl-accepting chemotaxis protein [Bacteroidetes bacterium]|nr:methyl-accepting chemotaxis protein [Bacteroidota bacterium]
MFSRLFYSTRFRLIGGFSVIILFIIVVLLTVVFSVSSVINLNSKAIEAESITTTVVAIKADQNRTRALVLDMMLTKKQADQARIKDQILKKKDEINGLVKRVQDYYKDSPDDMKQVNIFLQLINTYRQNRELQFQLIDSGKIPEAISMGSGIQAETYEKIRAIIDGFENKEAANARQLRTNAENTSRTSESWILGIGIVAILISVIMAFAMFSMLRKIIRGLRNSITVLSESTANILSTVTEVSTGAAETATAIAETTTTIEEVRQTAELSNEKANLVAETSQKASNIAIKGKQSVLETIEGMRKISQQMMVITESVIKLSEQSRTIAEITSTVTDIADQSNLLAVNAAIEAAKAGEQGRGFAVVAQEIRSLAEQSKLSTAQVKEILNDIQKSVNLAVQATENGNTVVETGSILSAQSGEVIQLMTDSVTDAAQAAIQISASSQQQKAGMEQLVPAMENIKLASEQSVVGNKQTQKAAQSLDELGKNLKKLIDRYKV